MLLDISIANKSQKSAKNMMRHKFTSEKYKWDTKKCGAIKQVKLLSEISNEDRQLLEGGTHYELSVNSAAFIWDPELNWRNTALLHYLWHYFSNKSNSLFKSYLRLQVWTLKLLTFIYFLAQTTELSIYLTDMVYYL